jgi:hypothetical protein
MEDGSNQQPQECSAMPSIASRVAGSLMGTGMKLDCTYFLDVLD